ncbi:hypothetical protein G6F43_010330 [Rhizopus delemar]|nr:hypothetical protein G6F43_010330 [Rhizopus delemar]
MNSTTYAMTSFRLHHHPILGKDPSIGFPIPLASIFVVFKKVSTTPDLNMPTVKQLQTELAATKAEINQLQQQNASLLERLSQTSNATAPTHASTATVFRPPAFPSP